MTKLLTDLEARIRSGRLLSPDYSSGKGAPFAPATPTDVVIAEGRLHFPIPPLLRDIYLLISNGGFGPGYGLLGVQTGARMSIGQEEFDLVDLYESFCTQHRPPQWPQSWLPVCHWGCSIYSCIDCSSSDALVLAFDTNRKGDGPWQSECKIHASSLAEWLRRWLDGEDLLRSMPLTGEPLLGNELR